MAEKKTTKAQKTKNTTTKKTTVKKAAPKKAPASKAEPTVAELKARIEQLEKDNIVSQGKKLGCDAVNFVKEKYAENPTLTVGVGVGVIVLLMLLF